MLHLGLQYNHSLRSMTNKSVSLRYKNRYSTHKLAEQ